MPIETTSNVQAHIWECDHGNDPHAHWSVVAKFADGEVVSIAQGTMPTMSGAEAVAAAVLNVVTELGPGETVVSPIFRVPPPITGDDQ